jgi:hypothetical protein
LSADASLLLARDPVITWPGEGGDIQGIRIVSPGAFWKVERQSPDDA